MRTFTVMAVVVAAVMIIGSGPALAAGTKAPEPGTWQHHRARETGTLPAPSSVKAAKASGRADASARVIEIGGRAYRVGIDTN